VSSGNRKTPPSPKGKPDKAKPVRQRSKPQKKASQEGRSRLTSICIELREGRREKTKQRAKEKRRDLNKGPLASLSKRRDLGERKQSKQKAFGSGKRSSSLKNDQERRGRTREKGQGRKREGEGGLRGTLENGRKRKVESEAKEGRALKNIEV